MLSTVSRAAARSVPTAGGVVRISSSQLLPRHAPAVSTGLVAATRALTVSAVARLPAAKAAATSKKAASDKTASKKSAAGKAPKKTKTASDKGAKAAAKASKKKTTDRIGRPPKEEDDEAVAKKKLRKEIRQLAVDALVKAEDGPDLQPTHPWRLFVQQNLKPDGTNNFVEKVKAVNEAYKNLTADEREEMSKTIVTNQVVNKANYKAWVDAHTRATIYTANQARRRLSRLTGKRHVLIEDDRLPKMTTSPFAHFVQARFPNMPDVDVEATATTDARYNSSTVKILSLSEEWKLASDAEKRPYEEAARLGGEQYHAEMEVLRAEVADEKVVKDAEKKAKEAAARAKKAKASKEYRRRLFGAADAE